MTSAHTYLSERGILEATATRCGLEIEAGSNVESIRSRLGFGDNGHAPLEWDGEAVLWVPLTNAKSVVVSWTARFFPPVIIRGESRKFLLPPDRPDWPFVPWVTWEIVKRTDVPLYVVEGPTRSLVLYQAGACGISLNGVWNTAFPRSSDTERVTLHHVLRLFDWSRRETFIGFDRDLTVNQGIREALIRLAFMLHAKGANLRLLSWDSSKGKGLDDFVADQAGSDPAKQRAIVRELSAQAEDLFSTLQPNDLDLVSRELKKVLLSPAERAQLCKRLAGPLEVRASLLEDIREEKEPETQMATGRLSRLAREQSWEPWTEPVSSESWLDEVFETITKCMIVSEHKAVAATLYELASYCSDFVDHFPILHITAGTKDSGKSEMAILLAKMAYRARLSSNASPAAIYYRLSEGACTWIVDEMDSMGGERRDLLTQLLNGSYTREFAYVDRGDADSKKDIQYPTFGPKIVVGSGLLNDTTQSRAIKILMERMKKGEKIANFRRIPFEAWERLCRQGVRWAIDNGPKIRALDPDKLGIPEDIFNRLQTNWFLPVAIAYLSGEEWHKKALGACRELALDSAMDDGGAEDETAKAEKLIRDLARVCRVSKGYYELGREKDSTVLERFFPTLSLLDSLKQLPDDFWQEENRGHGLSSKSFAHILQRFGLKSARPWIAQAKAKISGYYLKDLAEVFEHYAADIWNAPPDDGDGGASVPAPKMPPEGAGRVIHPHLRTKMEDNPAKLPEMM